MSIEYFSKDNIYAQVGPVPTNEVNPGTQTEYPKDSYNFNDIKIPWGWIIFFFVFIGILVGVYLIIKKKLEEKDRDEKAAKWTIFEVRVPRTNEIEIGEAEKMFANLTSIGGKGKG